MIPSTALALLKAIEAAAMVTIQKSRGRTIVLDRKTGKPKAPNKAPRTVQVAKRNKQARQVKAWAKAGRKTT